MWLYKGLLGSFVIFSIQNLLLKYTLRRHLHNQAINWLLPSWWWNGTMEYVQCHLFHLKVSFSSNSFLSLLDSFTKKSAQSQQLALKSSFPEFMTVLSVMTTSLSATKWRTKSRRISWCHSPWICPPILFLLLWVLSFIPMFYITFFVFPDFYFPDVLLSSYRMKIVKIGFKNLLLLLLLPSAILVISSGHHK